MTTTESQTQRRLFLSAILELWHMGLDTQEISESIVTHQAEVERGLHEALEIERRLKRHDDKKDEVS